MDRVTRQQRKGVLEKSTHKGTEKGQWGARTTQHSVQVEPQGISCNGAGLERFPQKDSH